MAQRWLKKINEKFRDGNYCVAHQIYRVAYQRLLKEDKWAEVYELLLSGSLKLFGVKEHENGTDLASLLIDVLAKVDSPSHFNRNESEIIYELKFLYGSISPNSPERLQFFNKTLMVPYLQPANVRKFFAEVLYKEKNYSDSRELFIHSSDDGSNCALMLTKYQTDEAYPNEVDLMIAQFVLQVLCIGNEQLAISTFHFYTLNHPKIKCTKPPFMSPLLNFISFLITCIENYRGNIQKFDVLCSLYEDSINRDPCYKDYLIKIGEIYFGVVKQSNSSGLVSNFLQSYVNGKEEVHSASSPAVSNSNQDVDIDFVYELT